MKRVRIILLAIAASATIGTALAFKVKKLGSTDYCFKITDIQPQPGECITCLEKVTAVHSSRTVIFYTTTSNCENCSKASDLRCTNKAHLSLMSN